MNKGKAKILITFALVVALATTPTLSLINKANANAESAESEKLYDIETIYPLSTVVTDVNYDTDIVTCTDFNGNEWTFEGCEDWQEGDRASLLMFNNDTEIIYDDVILKAHYNGWVY